MADFGSAFKRLGDDLPVRRFVGFSRVTTYTYVIGSDLTPVVQTPLTPPVAPVVVTEDVRLAGDYLARFHNGSVPTARTSLYSTLSNVRAVVRHMLVVNEGAANVTLQLWLSGMRVEPGFVVPAGQSIGQDLPGWVVLPGEEIEAQASASGLSISLHGVEEVS